jgi:hypothetical protein
MACDVGVGRPRLFRLLNNRPGCRSKIARALRLLERVARRSSFSRSISRGGVCRRVGWCPPLQGVFNGQSSVSRGGWCPPLHSVEYSTGSHPSVVCGLNLGFDQTPQSTTIHHNPPLFVASHAVARVLPRLLSTSTAVHSSMTQNHPDSGAVRAVIWHRGTPPSGGTTARWLNLPMSSGCCVASPHVTRLPSLRQGGCSRHLTSRVIYVDD